MRIGTWNLEHALGREKNALRREHMLEADADVWGLTETNDAFVLDDAHSTISSDPRPHSRDGGRWVTIASRLPVLRRIETRDPCRTTAALLASPHGDLLVYGTVLPWHSDRGPSNAARNWEEHHRVIPEQGAEWAALAGAFPDAYRCVAGDFNTDLDGPRIYGTTRGRAALREALAGADLVAVTATDRLPQGMLERPPIDHVALARPIAMRARVVKAWEGTTAAGVRMSDHSALVAEVPDCG